MQDGNVKATSRPHWDDTINDLTVHKLTSGDVARRKAGRVPRPSQPRSSTANSKPNTANSKSSRKFESTKEELLCEMFANKGRLLSVLKQSDKTVTVVRNSFQDCKYIGSVRRAMSSQPLTLAQSGPACEVFPRFRGLPNITRAPTSEGSEPCNVVNSQLNEVVSSNSENDLTEDLCGQLDNQSRATVVTTDRESSGCDDDESEEEVEIDFDKEIKSRVESESASRRSQRQEASDKVSPGSAVSNSKTSGSSGSKQFRLLKLGIENAEGDVFDSLDRDNDVTHIVAPIVDRTRQQVEDLKKLVDALTLELISTNDRYNSLAEEFRVYKEKNERKVSALEFPECENDWKDIAKRFEVNWNFPNCLGAVDGKHVAIVPLTGSGSFYYNYKGYHSLVLLAIANADYEFIYVSFGVNGRVSDGGVLSATDFYEKLINNKLRLPKKHSTSNLPYVFVGDEAFTLRQDFLKPFNRKILNHERKIYNYRLSRARRVVENVFGILVARFGIFKTSINMKVENIESVVMACCFLHNFLKSKSPKSYSPPECFDNEDVNTGATSSGFESYDVMVSLDQGHNRNTSKEAKKCREQFERFFNGGKSRVARTIHLVHLL